MRSFAVPHCRKFCRPAAVRALEAGSNPSLPEQSSQGNFPPAVPDTFVDATQVFTLDVHIVPADFLPRVQRFGSQTIFHPPKAVSSLAVRHHSRPSESLSENLAVLDALEQGDLDKAEHAVRKHVSSARNTLLSHVMQGQDQILM